MEDHRLLVVEDEPVTRMMLDAQLRTAGFLVTTVESAEAALGLLHHERFPLMITDLLLLQMDGLTLLREAKALDPDLEVIVLTGAASLESAIAAINLGAAGYLRKPASLNDLVAQVKVVIAKRRLRLDHLKALRQLGTQLLHLADPAETSYVATPPEQRLRVGRLEIDPMRRRVAVDQQPVRLSHGEFDLILYLARHSNCVVPVEKIAREVLAYHGCTTDEARQIVKAMVYRVRRKVEPDPDLPCLLISVRGAGYMLTSDDPDSF
ncbi:response regulator transcription factor [Candidatus Chloroploca sp. Khr17]|uniref:response regulator transcription factor n=1 Tax=Candidatus Chloroploca sp. Khr17 TaxID=2496869 RepID=UPI00101C9649|nr:response regulator transcription factor [Candidatus Chloroploca sp. Khr17]